MMGFVAPRSHKWVCTAGTPAPAYKEKELMHELYCTIHSYLGGWFKKLLDM